jgi:hypothetical protein
MLRLFPALGFFQIGLWVGLGLVRPVQGEDIQKSSQPATAEAKSAQVPKELLTGKVVLLGEALKRKGITSFEEMHKQAVLETPDGEIIPLVADWRGRAFFQDKRLRDRPVELVGTRKPGVPYLQVLMVFTFDKNGQRTYTDYWCDVCSIPMYEIKPCDCCQGDIRLRFQPQDLPDYLPKSKPEPPSGGKTGP